MRHRLDNDKGIRIDKYKSVLNILTILTKPAVVVIFVLYSLESSKKSIMRDSASPASGDLGGRLFQQRNGGLSFRWRGALHRCSPATQPARVYYQSSHHTGTHPAGSGSPSGLFGLQGASGRRCLDRGTANAGGLAADGRRVYNTNSNIKHRYFRPAIKAQIHPGEIADAGVHIQRTGFGLIHAQFIAADPAGHVQCSQHG